MHPNAIDSVRRHVAGILQNCVIEAGWPEFRSYYAHLESLGTELIKHKKEWIDIDDVYNIFFTLTYDKLATQFKSPNDQSGLLKVLLGEAGIEALTEYLTDFYCRIPFAYDIYLKTPEGNIIFPSLQLSQSFALASFSKDDDIPWGPDLYGGGLLLSAMSDPSRFHKPKAYFKSSISGYCRNSHRNQTVRRALTNFKIAIFQALYAEIIHISNRRPATLGLLGGLTHHSVEKHYLECIEKHPTAPRIIRVELPFDLSLFLGSLELNETNNSPLNQISADQHAHVIGGIFKAASALIDSRNENAGRIKSAIEWCVDSYTTENSTISFLQICIALEAIFGDENGREGLTKTLADRCAYLIGTSIVDRKMIRENFEELYRVRSKLVHGSVASLSLDERKYLEWGRGIAKQSIQKEIMNLRLI
ncbi:HEPN domain-containing protein [Trinickia mobilis]|uniref:HEPN domain-containing protein n=1 Tax=Trinickia mobilis TaxID=2816356 RepID=UPI001A8F9120|nr:HEPN domain-containing protein [Trinickia mobilis]